MTYVLVDCAVNEVVVLAASSVSFLHPPTPRDGSKVTLSILLGEARPGWDLDLRLESRERQPRPVLWPEDPAKVSRLEASVLALEGSRNYCHSSSTRAAWANVVVTITECSFCGPGT